MSNYKTETITNALKTYLNGRKKLES